MSFFVSKNSFYGQQTCASSQTEVAKGFKFYNCSRCILCKLSD
jgi:hypothetical protein